MKWPPLWEKTNQMPPQGLFRHHICFWNLSLVCYFIFLSFFFASKANFLTTTVSRPYVIVNQNQIVASSGPNPPKWSSGARLLSSPCDTGVICSFSARQKQHVVTPYPSTESLYGRCSMSNWVITTGFRLDHLVTCMQSRFQINVKHMLL